MSGKEVRAGKAFVEIVAKQNLGVGLRQAAARLRAFSATLAGIGAAMATTVGAVVTALGFALKSFSDTGDAIEKMASRTGLAAEAVSELGYAAGLSGTNVETLETALRKMQQTIADAREGSTTAALALSRLGISLAMLGESPDAQLEVFANAIAAIEDPAKRAQAAIAVFGRSGTALIPLLANGAAGLKAMRDEANRLGLTVSSETAADAAALNDAMGRLSATTSSLSFNIAAALAPALTSVADILAESIGWVNNWIKEHKEAVQAATLFVGAVGTIAGGLLAVSAAIYGAVFVATQLGVAFGAASAVATAAGGIMAGALAAIFSPAGLAVRAIAGVGLAFLKLTDVGDEITTAFGKAFGELAGIAGETWKAVVAALRAGDVGAAASAITKGFRDGMGVLSRLFEDLASAGRSAWTAIATGAARGAASLQRIWDETRDALVKGWSSLTAIARAAWDRIAAAVVKSAAALPGILARTWEAIKAGMGEVPRLLAAAWRGIADIGRKAFDALPDSIRPGLAAVAAFAGSLVEDVTAIFSSVGRFIASAFQTGLSAAAEVFKAMIGPLWPLVFDGLEALGGTVASLLGRAFSAIGSTLLAAPRKAVDFLLQAPGWIARNWGKVVEAIGTHMQRVGEVLQNPWQAVRDAASGAASFLGNVWQKLVDALPGVLKPVVGAVAGIARFLFEPLYRAAVWVVDSVGSALGDLASIITAPIGYVQSLVGDFVASFPGKIQAAFQSLPSIAERAWQAIVDGAGMAGTFISDAFASAGAFLQETWALVADSAMQYVASIGQGFADLGSGISDAFWQLVDDAKAAWEGISAALAVGDFKKAWSIAWIGIQTAFWNALKPIQVGWIEFTTGLASLLDGAIVTIRQSWNNVTTWIAEQLVNLMKMLQTTLDKLAEFDPSGLAAELSASLTVDIDGMKTALEKDRDRFNKMLADAKRDRDQERVDKLNKAKGDIDKKLADLKKARDDLAKAATDASGGKGLGDIFGPVLADLMNFDLDKLLGKLGFKGFGGAIDKLKAQLDGGAAAVAKTVDPVGTFSAQAAAMIGIGGQNPNFQIAKNTGEALRKLDEVKAAVEGVEVPAPNAWGT